MSESDHENVYERTYIMNEDQRQVARLRSRYMITGESHMPFEQWLAQHPTDHFYTLVNNGIKPLINACDYHIPLTAVELGNRIAYWAWETAVYHQTGRRRRIESNQIVGSPKSRTQYENYTFHLTTTDWNGIFDEWAHDSLFNSNTLEGTDQRNGLPEFIWKFIRDDSYGGSDYESSDEEEAAPKNTKVKMSDLGWITNNRRVF